MHNISVWRGGRAVGAVMESVVGVGQVVVLELAQLVVLALVAKEILAVLQDTIVIHSNRVLKRDSFL